MNFQETIDYLYSRLPVFQNVGARAFKPGLHTTKSLCKSLGDPQEKFPTVHVGGTNGKGSTSHMLAAILQQSGYNVGLYTSPHLKDFRERIRVNGTPVSEEFVIQFVEGQTANFDELNPSFFEATVAMAFSYFADCEVDIAVIEVGMGGRLDSTNIIVPEVSVITNISYDHMQFLGETLPEIAGEKAGIIKSEVPVVISETQDKEVQEVFSKTALSLNAPILFADQQIKVADRGLIDGKLSVTVNAKESGKILFENLLLDLAGTYQIKNLAGVLAAKDILVARGWNISDEAVADALKSVTRLTGLKGRWQKLRDAPLVYCDTAHNKAGLSETILQFASLPHRRQRFVIGFVADKDISGILSLFPTTADYYFCQPSNMRALVSGELAKLAAGYGLNGRIFNTVNQALSQAISDSESSDTIYVGGSTFVVADLDDL